MFRIWWAARFKLDGRQNWSLMSHAFCINKEGSQGHCYLHSCRQQIMKGPQVTTEWSLFSGVEWRSSDIPCQNMKYGNSTLCISPRADISSPPFAQICPSFLAHGHWLKSAHLGCAPMAQLRGRVFACSPGPFPMEQPVCLTSLSRLSLRHSRVLCFLPPTQPFSFWASLSRDSEIASGAALRNAAFRAPHCRQMYRPQKMTGPLLEDPMASLTRRSAFVHAILSYGDGWILIPRHHDPEREGNSILCSIFISPHSLGCFCKVGIVHKLDHKAHSPCFLQEAFESCKNFFFFLES